MNRSTTETARRRGLLPGPGGSAWTVPAAAVVTALALYRRWHLRWGATRDEVSAAMPGDELLPRAQFIATRAITIEAAPEHVWPWLVQVGFGRAGFYSYDLLDNLGRDSAAQILDEFQHPHVGDVAAPMTSPPTEATSFRVRASKRTGGSYGASPTPHGYGNWSRSRAGVRVC